MTTSSLPECDILILTVTKVEISAVLRASGTTAAECPKHRGTNKTYFDLGEIGEARVFAVRSEMGSATVGGSLPTIIEAIAETRPTIAIMVGIAFGVESDSHQIGDVLVSKQIQNYDLQRVGTSEEGAPEIILRGDCIPASERLLDRMRTYELEWENQADVHFGLVLSGEKLIDNYDYREHIRELVPEAIGGEMEGNGFYIGCHRAKKDWIVVKAICDWADGNKGKAKSHNQQIAARNAAEFVIQTIAAGGVVHGIGAIVQSSHVPIGDQNAGAVSVAKAVETSTVSVTDTDASEITEPIAHQVEALNENLKSLSELVSQLTINKVDTDPVADLLVDQIREYRSKLDTESAELKTKELEDHYRTSGNNWDIELKKKVLVTISETVRNRITTIESNAEDFNKLKSLLSEIDNVK